MALPLLIVVGLVWVYPFLWIVAGAFKTQNGLFTGGASLIPDSGTSTTSAGVGGRTGFPGTSSTRFSTRSHPPSSKLFKSALCGYVLARTNSPDENCCTA
ncbi:hypothetical protein GCM10017687_27720 [Streptomyces echinatus]